MDREAWRATVHGVAKSRTQPGDGTAIGKVGPSTAETRSVPLPASGAGVEESGIYPPPAPGPGASVLCAPSLAGTPAGSPGVGGSGTPGGVQMSPVIWGCGCLPQHAQGPSSFCPPVAKTLSCTGVFLLSWNLPSFSRQKAVALSPNTCGWFCGT